MKWGLGETDIVDSMKLLSHESSLGQKSTLKSSGARQACAETED